MKAIPKERKEAVLAKMTGPDRKSVPVLAAEEGISTATLYNWRKEARQQGRLMPDHDDSPEGWSSRDKFNAVLETAALSEAELGEYCRRRGLYPEQIARWREACSRANDFEASERVRRERLQREERARVRKLEKELRRKDKALAETAALLALRKKTEAIWGDEDA
jgi:transposase-like protein